MELSLSYSHLPTLQEILHGINRKQDLRTNFQQYACVLYRDNIHAPVQATTPQIVARSPESSVIRIDVKNIKPLFDELIQRGMITQDAFKQIHPGTPM